jgi:hypothetical protein
LVQQKTLPDEPSQGWDFDNGLKGVKSINGLNEDADKINGMMNGDEEIHGGATVGGNTFNFAQQKAAPAPPAATPAQPAASASLAAPATPTPATATPATAPASLAVPAGSDGGLKDVKISVQGDRVSGMNGDEQVYGPAVVTGTHVTFNK